MDISILYPPSSARELAAQAPACFGDLNLDQVVAAAIAGKQEYDLAPFFYTPLRDVRAIGYRQAVMQDLAAKPVQSAVERFAQQMRTMREHLAQAERLPYTLQQQRWQLDAVRVYCAAVQGLAADLEPLALHAEGLLALRAYLAEYVQSPALLELQAEAKALADELAGVRYCLSIKGNTVTVRHFVAESDLSAAVEQTFARFRQDGVRSRLATIPSWPDMNSVEAKILDCVAQLYPELFAALAAFCTRHRDFVDEVIRAFDREVQFYVAWLEFMAIFERRDLAFCYPQVSAVSKAILSRASYDLALAFKLAPRKTPVVCNDFCLAGRERILVVTGPNQGGKTTFARTFGQLHYLASLGLPVPGTEARLFLCDGIFTHFEKEEELANLRGKLEDDLVRIHAILAQATPDSLVIMNEIFNSTTLVDALLLSGKVLEQISALDVLCVCVTFLDELATLNDRTVSMVGGVVPGDPTSRTYKIERRPADGLAYALAVAEQHGLTYAALRPRLPKEQRPCKPA